jgi:O-antigen ligase
LGAVQHLSLQASSARRSRWETVFLFLVGSLASTILLKIASIQYLELLYVVQLIVLAFAFYQARLRVYVYRRLLLLGIGYVVVAVFALLLAVTALRFTFYKPAEVTLLQEPVLITFSRVFELLIDAGMMLYLANFFRTRPDTARFTMRVYYWVGVASAAYSLVSYPLDRAHIVSLGAYGDLHRFRGFYNEGGPYGLYVITLVFVGWSLMRIGWESKRRIQVSLLLLVTTLVMSQSKAAFVALLTLLVLRSVFSRSLRQRAATISIALFLLLLLLQTFDLGSKIRLYKQAGEKYETASHLHAGDPNVVQGRIAGLFLVPRMIAAHPFTGVGWGNYGIVRNDPQYRGAAAWGEPDEPGLGVLGLAAEIGLPLLGVLFVYLVLPYFWLHRLHVPEHIANLALLQPVVHLFGAQLNLTYPWIVTAFALGLGFAAKYKSRVSEVTTEAVVA